MLPAGKELSLMELIQASVMLSFLTNLPSGLFPSDILI